jgi:glucose-1-phosphate thymidylyltransferase
MRQPDDVALEARQAAAADAGLKFMMPFPRPFLDYLLHALADAGCTDVCLIVSPGADMVRRYYRDERPPRRVRVTFTEQETPLGTANALLAAEPFAAGDPFLVMNADTYYPLEVLRPLVGLRAPGLPAFRRSTLLRDGNIDAERVLSYAVLRIGRDHVLEDIVEKPDAATAKRFGDDFFVSLNCWRFDARIFPACRAIGPSARGELELPEAVGQAIGDGVRFVTFEAAGGVLDLSRRSDVAEVGRHLATREARP